MSKRCKLKLKEEDAADASGEDLISALPDAVLQVVLSFLPSDETARTCVLARRWLHLWKSTPALRIIQGFDRHRTALKLNNFVNYLLLLRDRSALDECEISYDNPCRKERDEIFRFADVWIRHAVSLCQVQVLRVFIGNVGIHPRRDSALMSQFLGVVELTGLILCGHSLDFSSCPLLEDLTLCSSRIYCRKISSQSLRRLSITRCWLEPDTGSRMHIAAPALISLQLADVLGRAPLLESMPALVTAFIRLGHLCFENSHGSNYSVLLQGLSGATRLELTTSDPDVFIFRKDLKQRPTFSMLKTLLINEWCVAAGFGALVYLLQCMPVLEKLIIQLRLEKLQGHNSVIETYERYNPLKHLEVVEIKCHKEDEVVHQIVKILSTFGVPSDQIDIQVIQQTYSSQSFSFEQTEILD